MLVPRTHVALPDREPLRTRRPLSGVLVHGLTAAPLHALLSRGRVCVVHTVEGPAQNWSAVASIPAFAAAPTHVRVPVGDRAEWLAVAVTYRAERAAGGAAPVVSIRLWDSADGAPLDAAVLLPVPSTAVDGGYFGTRYEVQTATTTDRRDVALLVGRPLLVPVGSAGATLVVRLTPSTAPSPAVQICSVTIYELPSDAEAP